jgi:outer membrane receptor for ferrienterochelin and colicin
MRPSIYWLGLWALLFATQFAVADDLQEVLVTATRSARSLSDIPESASIVTATQVQDTPAQSLDDVLRHVPGVNLPIQSGIEAHPTADNISMRGLGRAGR